MDLQCQPKEPFSLRREWHIIAVLLGSYTIFNLLLINTFFTPTEGWFQHYAQLILGGQVPYRDFYLFVPPGFQWLSTFLYVITNGSFLALRYYGLLERLVMLFLTYALLRNVFPKWAVFLATLSAGIVYIANIQDIFYGYYQTSMLLSLLLVYLMMYMVRKSHGSKMLLLFGSLCGLIFLFKQTIGLILPVSLIAFYIVISMRQGSKKLWRDLLWIFIGCLFVILPTIVYLFSVGALVPFLSQVFGGAASKGSLFTVLFAFIPRIINRNSLLLCFCICVSLLFPFIPIYRNTFRKAQSVWVAILSTVSLYYVILNYVVKQDSLKSQIGLSLIFLLSFVFCLYTLWYGEKKGRYVPFYLYISALFTSGFFMMRNGLLFLPTLSDVMMLRDMRQHLLYAVFFVELILLFVEAYRVFANKQYTRTPFLLLMLSSVAMMYTHGLSAVIEDHTMLLALSIFLCIILGNVEIRIISFMKNAVVFLCCITCAFTVFQQRIELPYHWWGVGGSPKVAGGRVSLKDPKLSGFLLEPAYVDAMDQINDSIGSRIQPKDTLFSFPHINYFNVATKLDSPTFAKVHYFDVCPDDVALADAQRLLDNPPTFIVWMALTEDEWTTHEKIFRGGKPCGQREIMRAYESLTTSGAYTLLEETRIGNSDPVFVWHLTQK